MLRVPQLRIHQRLQLRSMASKKCSECGAELRLRPHRCPLCGEVNPEAAGELTKRVSAPERYQAEVRELREQLKKLREGGAEAV